MKTSYHSHTRWCKHADGEIEDYVKKAIELNLEMFAICDHVFNDIPLGPRAPWSEYDAYLENLKQVEAKYENQIELQRSIEAEYYPELMERYQTMKEKDHFAVWILGQHESSDHQMDFFKNSDDIANKLERYTEDVIEALETGFFNILAHPDLFMMYYTKPDKHSLECMDRIFRVCEKNNVVIEINANGIRGHKHYPNREVFELSKKYNLRYIISSDAHNPEFLYDDAMRKAEEFADDLKLNVINRI